MTQEYIPREGDPLPIEELMPGSPRELYLLMRIEKILMRYTGGVNPKAIKKIALEIWRVTRR